MVAIYVVKLWCIFKMQLCMWCRKKAPGIQECLVNALKITCTQFETPESPGIRIACILVFFSSISAGTARNLWGDINSIYVSAGNSQEQEPGCQQEDPPPLVNPPGGVGKQFEKISFEKTNRTKKREKKISFRPNGPRQITIQASAIQTDHMTSLNSPYNPIFAPIQELLLVVKIVVIKIVV